MATIKVSIKDRNTLELQENGSKGDTIDLSKLDTADVSFISEALKTSARKEVEKEIEIIKSKELEAKLLKQEKQLNEKYQKQILELEVDKNKIDMISKNQIKDLHEELARVKDFRLKQSTKMLGETLERHCDVAFESIRGFLPSSAEFIKDTKVIEGSLGDRIYREYDEQNNEVLSIMFEMKNEADATATKIKNEHFFKELDKDRNQKSCEYAVLVSLLEKDNDIYDGIYTVPESKYKDMFVIRPQHFTQIIMWLRNVSSKLAISRREIIAIKQSDRDFTEFDNAFTAVRDNFNKHYANASTKHSKAIEDIDKMIKNLEKIKTDLQGSTKQLQLASEDLEDLTVKKLAKHSPSILKQIKKTSN